MQLDWNNIDTVLLDMDGTLLDLYFDNYFWHEHLPLHWSRKEDIDLQQAKDELIPRIRQHEGTLNWYCLDFWSRELQIDIMRIKEEIRELIKIRKDAIEFLQFLNKTNKQVVMVTNAHHDLVRMKFEHTGIGEYFQQVYCSHQFGHPKEDEQFWYALNDAFQFNKERSVLFDDNLNVLKSAQTYGIRTLVSIVQPDSSKPQRTIDNYPAIDLFAEVMHSD